MDAFFINSEHPMKQKAFLTSLLLLPWLTACTIILPSPIVIIREQVSSAVPSQTATVSPTVTATPTATASPSATPTATESQARATTLNRLNIRSGAGTSFSIIGVLPVGQTVAILGRNADNSWLQIGADRWINSQFVTITGNLNAAPVIVPPTPEPTPTQEILGRTRISYNVNAEAIPDRVYLRAHLIRLCPTTVLFMNGMAFAVEMEQALRSCGTRVAHRTYSIYEGDEWVRRSPQEIVNAWIAEGHPEIVRYSVNEPSYGGNHSIQSFVASQVELMRLARNAGFTVIVGNNAVGSWRFEDILAGHYDPMLQAIAEYGHYLGLHEYTQTILPFGVSQWPREWLLDPNRVQPANWPTVEQLPLAMQYDPVIRAMNCPRYYHLRRGDCFLLRADKIGVARPRIWLTEWSWDSLADIKASIEPLRNPFCVIAGTRPSYLCDLRGVNTYERLWGYYYPQWSFAEAACQQIKWGISIYPPEYIGMNLFTWSVNPHWLHSDFSGRGNADMYQLHICLEAA
jgi:hypothetical protein